MTEPPSALSSSPLVIVVVQAQKKRTDGTRDYSSSSSWRRRRQPNTKRQYRSSYNGLSVLVLLLLLLPDWTCSLVAIPTTRSLQMASRGRDVFYESTQAKQRHHTTTVHRKRISSFQFMVKYDDDSDDFSNFLPNLLANYGYDDRIVWLSQSDLPVLAEVQEDGATKVCQIVEIIHNTDNNNNMGPPPKFRLQFQNDDGSNNDNNTVVVDVGQITTIWSDQKDTTLTKEWSNKSSSSHSATTAISEKLLMNAPQVNAMLERLYKSRVGQGRSSNAGTTLSKKQINKVASTQSPLYMDPEQVAQILRQVLKTGPNHARLIDSMSISEGKKQHQASSSQSTSIQQRLLLAQLLGDSQFNGGRFKRWPCLWLPTTNGISTTSTRYNNEISTVLVNGGWLVLDQSVRATLEGQMFVEQQQTQQVQHDQEVEGKVSRESSSTTQSQQVKVPKIGQEVEQRIVRRLECLAMGEESTREDKKLEVDVHTTLRAMNLPLTSNGARDALVRMGRWTTEDSNSARTLPFSRSVLKAAEQYVAFNDCRSKNLFHQVERIRNGLDSSDDVPFEGRSDLTSLPCLCVDAAKASFRDDAIGIRPRASTGRLVNAAASKWEILLHIADVSDIYAPSDDRNGELQVDDVRILEKAAASRGSSRYDLPGGPLHMLPINVLESMALDAFKPDWTSGESLDQQLRLSSPTTANRCVTVWIYIDEKSGKIIDAGIERTLISRPVALSFHKATALLKDKSVSGKECRNEDPVVSTMKAILKVVERNIQLWSGHRISTSKTAQKREARMSSYEEMSRQVYGRSNRRDDGKDGFQRSRGHRLVDSSMNLYSLALTTLVQKAGGSLPQVVGATDGRSGTGPLRRYIDGVVQRQALSVLCGFGGKPLSRQECAIVGRKATETLNRNANSNASKQTRNSNTFVSNKVSSQRQQQEAVRMLKVQVRNLKVSNPILPAMSTGQGSEVILMGVGAVARCRGIEGTLRPGTKVKVRVERIDEQSGTVLTVLEQ